MFRHGWTGGWKTDSIREEARRLVGRVIPRVKEAERGSDGFNTGGSETGGRTGDSAGKIVNQRVVVVLCVDLHWLFLNLFETIAKRSKYLDLGTLILTRVFVGLDED